jgi:uncharacterized protein (DUF1697 family)
MTHYVAFLRAINAGHGRSLTMETLRRHFQPLGLANVETFIGSGNVLFAATGGARTLEGKIEERLQKAMKAEVPAFLRTEAELARIAVYQPFPAAYVEPEAEVEIIFLKAELDPETAQKVASLNSETDEFVVHEREIYWLRRRKAGASPYSTVALERIIGQPFTVRTSRTVRRLAAKYSEAYQSLVNMS